MLASKSGENPELLEYLTLPEVRDMMVGLGSRTKCITFTLNAVGGVLFERITKCLKMICKLFYKATSCSTTHQIFLITTNALSHC